MKFEINFEQNGKNIKSFINEYTKLSKKQLTKLKNLESGILLNGDRVTVRAILHTGDTLTLAIEEEIKTSDGIEPVSQALDIIYEDDYYIAVNKPPYTPTHPSHNHRKDTLANALSYRYKEQGLPFVFRAVNRLDKNTSGIVVFAKSAVAANCFSKLQQNGLVTKEYLSLVYGNCDSNGRIEGYIRRREKSIIFREFSETKNSDDAQYSLTEYKTLAKAHNYSLIKLVLHTGRTHQILVHMAHIGHSVIGDDLYGTADGESRQMLHSYCMKFTHPFTDEPITLIAPLPKDFISAAEKRGLNYEL